MICCGQELQPTVGDLRYAVLHSMLLVVTKNPPNVQKALKNFHEILSVDVRLLTIIVTMKHVVFTCLLVHDFCKGNKVCRIKGNEY